MPRSNPSAFEEAKQSAFAPFPDSLEQLLDQELVYGRYHASPQGINAAGTLENASLQDLIQRGMVCREGLRYEDFLPFSAAGIFASNLNQYGTASTADKRPTYSQEDLEAILGRSIIDTDAIYRSMEAESIKRTYEALGIST